MENVSEVPFCKNCGAPINMEKAADGYAGSEAGGNAQNNTSNQNGPYQNGPFMNGFPFAGFKPINPDDTIDGISVGDYVKYIGQNFFYFIPKFMRFSKGSKVSFNFSAFLFPHLYFFYRKMIPQGIIMLILQVVLSIPSVLFLFGEYGYISIDTLANASWFLYLANIFSIIAYIVDIAVGIFANWMYYRKAKKDITKIKSTIIEDNAQSTAIASGGGTSWAYVVAAFMAVLTLNLIIVFVMTKLIL